jgi:hypothetical protein
VADDGIEAIENDRIARGCPVSISADVQSISNGYPIFFVRCIRPSFERRFTASGDIQETSA